MNYPVGSFFRPVGNYAYCLEVVRVVPCEGGSHWTFKRHGMKEGKPFDDGHKSLFYMRDLVHVLPDVWKELARGWSNSMYYRLITLYKPVQIGLF